MCLTWGTFPERRLVEGEENVSATWEPSEAQCPPAGRSHDFCFISRDQTGRVHGVLPGCFVPAEPGGAERALLRMPWLAPQWV